MEVELRKLTQKDNTWVPILKEKDPNRTKKSGPIRPNFSLSQSHIIHSC